MGSNATYDSDDELPGLEDWPWEDEEELTGVYNVIPAAAPMPMATAEAATMADLEHKFPGLLDYRVTYECICHYDEKGVALGQSGKHEETSCRAENEEIKV